MTKVVRPFITSLSAAVTLASVAASSALVASSRIRIGGFFRSAGDRQPLALAAREHAPTLTDGRVQPIGVTLDELERLGPSAGGEYFRIGGVGLPTRRFSAIERLNSSGS